MKKLALILTLLCSVYSFAQNKLAKEDLAKIYKIKQEEGNVKALEYISGLKKSNL